MDLLRRLQTSQRKVEGLEVLEVQLEVSGGSGSSCRNHGSFRISPDLQAALRSEGPRTGPTVPESLRQEAGRRRDRCVVVVSRSRKASQVLLDQGQFEEPLEEL